MFGLIFVASLVPMTIAQANDKVYEEYVSTDAEDLLYTFPSDAPLSVWNWEKAKEFIDCFTFTLDVPDTVWRTCGQSIVKIAAACSSEEFIPCASAIVGVASSCKEPVLGVWSAAKTCRQEVLEF